MEWGESRERERERVLVPFCLFPAAESTKKKRTTTTKKTLTPERDITRVGGERERENECKKKKSK